MRALPAFAVVVAITIARGPSPAAAAPGADLIVYWAPADAPDALRDQAKAAAGRAGVAFVDASPAAAAPPIAATLVAGGTAAYGELRFDDAVAELDRAAAECDATGAAGLEPGALAELFLFRGLARLQRGDAAAWDDLVTAARVDPTRVLDPARFPPRAVEQLQRARDEVARQPRATLAVIAPVGCTIAIDGAVVAGGKADVAHGAHWVRAECPGRGRWGQRVAVAAPEVSVTATPPAIAPPDDTVALIQARAAGARAVIDVVVESGFARVRLRASDGRERDRRAVALAGDGAAALAATLDRLLAPPPPRRRWYRSRWMWAAGGAALTAAVLIPIAIAAGDRNGTVVIRPTGWPPW